MHWREFEEAVGKAGAKIRPSDWSDLARFLSVTTTTTAGGQRPEAHTTYVDFFGLLTAVAPRTALAKRPQSQQQQQQDQNVLSGLLGQQGTQEAGAGHHESAGQQQQQDELWAGMEGSLPTLIRRARASQPGGSSPYITSPASHHHQGSTNPSGWGPVVPPATGGSPRLGSRGGGMFGSPRLAPLATRFPRKPKVLPPLAGLDKSLCEELVRLLSQCGRSAQPDTQVRMAAQHSKCHMTCSDHCCFCCCALSAEEPASPGLLWDALWSVVL